MARPSLFLVCHIKVPDLRHRILIPLPLWVLDDLLQAAFSIWSLVIRLRPGLTDGIDSHLPGMSSIVPDVGRLFSTLRHAGPFTLVDVDDPTEGVKVSIKLI